MSVEHAVPLIVVISKPSFVLMSTKSPISLTLCCRAPQDPRMAGATPATPAIQDSNGTQGTRATTPDTLQDILDTPRNREVQGQGLAFHLR